MLNATRARAALIGSPEFFSNPDKASSRLQGADFINNRGDEAFVGTWSYLDMTALGRQELWEDSPEGYPQTKPYEWWNWHDEYGDASSGSTRCRPVSLLAKGRRGHDR